MQSYDLSVSYNHGDKAVGTTVRYVDKVNERQGLRRAGPDGVLGPVGMDEMLQVRTDMQEALGVLIARYQPNSCTL